MNSDMVKPKKIGHLHLAYHFTIPLSDYTAIIQLRQKNSVQKFISYLNDRAAPNFIDVVDEMPKNVLTDQVKKCKYISVLNDGSTDIGVIEELVYLSFTTEQEKPEVKFLSIESPQFTTAKGFKIVFSRIGMDNSSPILWVHIRSYSGPPFLAFGLNLDRLGPPFPTLYISRFVNSQVECLWIVTICLETRAQLPSKSQTKNKNRVIFWDEIISGVPQ